MVGLLIWLVTFSPFTRAQLPFDTDSIGPQRFVAVHGRKAIVMGYAGTGLELWAYPLQLISGYELGFRPAGETTEINASALLRRVTYEPEGVTRTYIGPDFIVHERLFVPLDEHNVRGAKGPCCLQFSGIPEPPPAPESARTEGRLAAVPESPIGHPGIGTRKRVDEPAETHSLIPGANFGRFQGLG